MIQANKDKKKFVIFCDICGEDLINVAHGCYTSSSSVYRLCPNCFSVHVVEKEKKKFNAHFLNLFEDRPIQTNINDYF